MHWMLIIVYGLLAAGAIASIINMFLQYYDIIYCRHNDCGNKNHETKTTKQPKDYHE